MSFDGTVTEDNGKEKSGWNNLYQSGISITEQHTLSPNWLPRVPWRLNPAIVAEDESIN